MLIVIYFITPYTVDDGTFIVIDADIREFLKILYTTTSIIFGSLFFVFLRIFKTKNYLICSFIFFIVSLIFLGKMFYILIKFWNKY